MSASAIDRGAAGWVPAEISGVGASARGDLGDGGLDHVRAGDFDGRFGFSRRILDVDRCAARSVVHSHGRLNGLFEGMTYFYQVQSADAAGNEETDAGDASQLHDPITPAVTVTDTTVSDFAAGSARRQYDRRADQ